MVVVEGWDELVLRRRWRDGSEADLSVDGDGSDDLRLVPSKKVFSGRCYISW